MSSRRPGRARHARKFNGLPFASVPLDQTVHVSSLVHLEPGAVPLFPAGTEYLSLGAVKGISRAQSQRSIDLSPTRELADHSDPDGQLAAIQLIGCLLQRSKFKCRREAPASASSGQVSIHPAFSLLTRSNLQLSYPLITPRKRQVLIDIPCLNLRHTRMVFDAFSLSSLLFNEAARPSPGSTPCFFWPFGAPGCISAEAETPLLTCVFPTNGSFSAPNSFSRCLSGPGCLTRFLSGPGGL